MKVIWAEDEAEYHGETRQLRPDLVVAETGAEAASADLSRRTRTEGARTASCATATVGCPIPARAGDAQGGNGGSLRSRARRQGATRSTLSVNVYGYRPRSAERCESYAKIGVDRAILALPSVGRDAALPLLDRYAEVVAKLQQD